MKIALFIRISLEAPVPPVLVKGIGQPTCLVEFMLKRLPSGSSFAVSSPSSVYSKL